MKRVSVVVFLLFALLCGVLGQDYQLSFSPNNATLVMGDSMTISWAGNCSVEYTTGCYDWLSVYPAAACKTGAGSNTCYMTNDWVWVDNIPVDSKPEGTYQHGSWNYQFLAPGQYQFRIARCWCGGCEPVLDDMLTCSSYPTITASPIVTVKPLFTGLDTLTESEQIVMGFLWWVLTSYQVPNTNGIIQALIEATGSNRAARGGSCVSDITDIVTSFESAAEAFYQLYEDFSLPGLRTCFGDVVTVLKGVAPVLSDCDVNEWTGNDFVADILTVINDLIPGLTEAEEIIKIAIEGKPIYIETVNFFSSLEAEEYFAAGVYFGRFVETVIPLLKN